MRLGRRFNGLDFLWNVRFLTYFSRWAGAASVVASVIIKIVGVKTSIEVLCTGWGGQSTSGKAGRQLGHSVQVPHWPRKEAGRLALPGKSDALGASNFLFYGYKQPAAICVID